MRARKRPPSPNMPQASPATSEYLTRKRIVDQKLRAAGWTVVPFKPERPLSDFEKCAIEEYPTDAGPDDYALCARGEILGVVEAKKLTLGPQEVLIQAERNLRGMVSNPLYFQGFRVPLLYSTNGEVILHHDVRHAINRSRQIPVFHTPDALREFLARNADEAADTLLAHEDVYPSGGG